MVRMLRAFNIGSPVVKFSGPCVVLMNLSYIVSLHDIFRPLFYIIGDSILLVTEYEVCVVCIFLVISDFFASIDLFKEELSM